jgi:AcrR family transcriptional regulator
LQQLYDERKEQIKKAAIRVFSRRGIPGTKISMIAQEAGVSHGLFYHYYTSKEDLFTTLIQEAVETSLAEFGNLHQASGTPLDKIRLMTEAMLDESGAPFFMLMHQARNSEGVPEAARKLIEQHPMSLYVDQLLPIFKEGQEKGEIVQGHPEQLISAYLTVLSGVMVIGEGYSIPPVDLLLRMVAR